MTIDFQNWQRPLNWPEIWRQFDKWIDSTYNDDWKNQKRTIKRIVNKAIKEQIQKGKEDVVQTK